MTSSSQLALGLKKENEGSFVQKLIDGVLGILNSLAVRLIIIFIIGSCLMVPIADNVYPKLITAYAQELIVRLANETKGEVPSGLKILRTINQYNLAWYYVTTTEAKVAVTTRPYTPDLSKYDIASRELDWKGKHYFEAVSHISDDRILHIGVYAGPIIMPALIGSMVMSEVPLSVGYVIFFIFGLLIITVAGLQFWVSKPLAHLSRSCYSLLLSRDAYSHITGGGLSVPGAVTEVQKVSKGLKDIRKQYDQAVVARVDKEEEIKRERTEHEVEKSHLSKQYEDQLASTNSRLTELHTKEAEEEFLNLLGKELDSLKSSKQVYVRILEILNDKYPTSIIFGTFFKVNKNLEPTLTGWIGFDDQSIQLLRKVDLLNASRQIFNSSTPLIVSKQALRDYGLNQIAQSNAINNVVFLPVKFQERNLGLLAFYFTQEGVLQDRLRVLRNVVDLMARSLYQVVIFEEETDAARTDPLTGLRNKKFFSEILPYVFERAAIKPEQNPISIIMIDGDHFKSVNDTYGHQIGDLMLQELAKTLKQCVRTQDSLERSATPGDYVVRFGGEEFVVLMEGTDSKRAISVAERIRAAVENKTDWPGGIIKWTISLGVATYPADGRNADDLLLKADNALYYVKEEMGRNKVCHCQQVPRSYKSKKKAAALGGELGVFDPAGLLQSVASSQKSGVLIVTNREQKNLWVLFDKGKAIQARLGKLAGNSAIVEFLVTFTDGNFKFQEQITGNDSKLAQLGQSYNLTKLLERCLIDGALAQDNYNIACTILSDTEKYMTPIAKEEFKARWNALAASKDAPSVEEFQTMVEIVKLCDGKTSLANIFKQLEQKGTPTHLMYRAAGFLVQQGFVETKPV